MKMTSWYDEKLQMILVSNGWNHFCSFTISSTMSKIDGMGKKKMRERNEEEEKEEGLHNNPYVWQCLLMVWQIQETFIRYLLTTPIRKIMTCDLDCERNGFERTWHIWRTHFFIFLFEHQIFQSNCTISMFNGSKKFNK